MNQKTIKKFGFTIVEIVVVVAIFALISGMMLADFRNGKKMDDLKRASQELVSNLRKVQVLGMSGEFSKICVGGEYDGKSCQSNDECSPATFGECQDAVPDGGYGIWIERVMNDDGPCGTDIFPCPKVYTVFVDSSGILGDYNPITFNPPRKGFDFALAGGDDYALPNKVDIIAYDICSSWLGGPYKTCEDAESYGMGVTFRPPKPTPYTFTPNPPDDPDPALYEQTVKILIRQEELKKCRLVTINGASGQIDDQPVTDVEELHVFYETCIQ